MTQLKTGGDDQLGRLYIKSFLVALIVLVPTAALAAWPGSPLVNVPVCTASGLQGGHCMTTDGAGGILVAWADERDVMPVGIYAAHVLADGTLDVAWPAQGRAVCTAAWRRNAPRIVSDGLGGAFIAWQDARDTTSSDIYLHHVLSDGQLDPAWPHDGLPVCDADSSQYLPQIAGDGSGGVWVAWYDVRSRVNKDIYCQHVLPTGALAPGWPADGLAVCTAPGDQAGPRLCVDAGGNAIVVWGDSRNGNADLYAQRLVSGGADPDWPANGAEVCTAAGSQQQARLVADGAGGAFIAWVDNRAVTNSDIYSAHIDSNGVRDPAWPVNGRVLCNAGGTQYTLDAVEVAPGVGVVAWMDLRNARNYDVYVQRIDGPTGDWPVNGRPVGSVGADQRNPMVAPDGSGGAIVVWSDLRDATEEGDAYAHHVLASGVLDPAWKAGGAAVSTANHGQDLPLALPDGSGGALVTWLDGRKDQGDIYAQRILSFGQLDTSGLDVPADGPPGLHLGSPSPNPTRGRGIDVRLSLPDARAATVELLDLQGRSVARQQVAGAGWHNVHLEAGGRLASGVYFVTLRSGTTTRTRRATILD